MSKDLKSRGLAAIAVLGSGNVVGTVISAIALILFSRFMGPAEFGLFSAAFAAMQIVVRVADLGTNMATERAIARVYGHDNQLADRLMRVGFWLKAVNFAACATIGWFIAPWIGSLLRLDSVSLIRSAILLASGTIFFEYTTLVFQATHHFGMVARITIAQAIGKLLFGFILIWQGILHATSGLLVYGLLPGVGALTAWVKNPLTSFTLPKSWQKDLWAILAVAKWTGLAAVAATLADNIDTLMVKSFMTSYDTGIWSGAVRIATFASLVGWSIGSVLNIRVAKYHDPAHLKTYLGKAWKLALLSFLVIFVCLPLAGFSIWVTIGQAYLSATAPLQILLIASGLAAATSPYVALFYLFDRPQYYALAGFISTGILLLGDYFAIPAFGLMGVAWIRVVVRIAVLVFTLLYARRAIEQHLSKV
jgi:O-antigen/teichoic acid export membrane protein